MGISLGRLWLLSSASTVIVFAVFVGKSVPSHAALSAGPTFVEVVISGASKEDWRHRHRTTEWMYLQQQLPHGLTN
jgi:hypothetical protein